ncbi:MAG TPA: hypothetical protein VLB67_15685 [Acidimicrobiia bacterium]|nr:hypothetical protein [Acidimicrobiia bacterium]
MNAVVGWALVLGLAVFAVGAARWRMEYERPLLEALRIIHDDRRRRAWIHLWMIAALFVTTAGLAGLAVIVPTGPATIWTAMGTAVYALGAVVWVVSLAFRLTVVAWAAEHTAREGRVPDGFVPFDAWAGSLYVIHMAASYSAFVVVGVGLLLSDLPEWTGWLGIVLGLVCGAGFWATRAAGPFNPPILAHLYSGIVGVALLLL